MYSTIFVYSGANGTHTLTEMEGECSPKCRALANAFGYIGEFSPNFFPSNVGEISPFLGGNSPF